MREEQDLFVERQRAAWFTLELLNFCVGGSLVFRKINLHEPENDLKVTLDSPKKVSRQLARLIEFCQSCSGLIFNPEEQGFDGVAITVRYGSKTWCLVDPEGADEPDVLKMGELVNALLDKLQTM